MAKKTVMLVDDAALMRTVIRNLLNSDPRYDVAATCANGQVALEMLQKQQFDLILCDIEMPVMDGLTFLRNARLRTNAKIVILSSVAGQGSAAAAKARQLGADAVIQKPSGSVSLDLAQKIGPQILDTLKRVCP